MKKSKITLWLIIYLFLISCSQGYIKYKSPYKCSYTFPNIEEGPNNLYELHNIEFEILNDTIYFNKEEPFVYVEYRIKNNSSEPLSFQYLIPFKNYEQYIEAKYLEEVSHEYFNMGDYPDFHDDYLRSYGLSGREYVDMHQLFVPMIYNTGRYKEKITYQLSKKKYYWVDYFNYETKEDYFYADDIPILSIIESGEEVYGMVMLDLRYPNFSSRKGSIIVENNPNKIVEDDKYGPIALTKKEYFLQICYNSCDPPISDERSFKGILLSNIVKLIEDKEKANELFYNSYY
jgi:hypothetical protein